jgi:hypothetical protein
MPPTLEKAVVMSAVPFRDEVMSISVLFDLRNNLNTAQFSAKQPKLLPGSQYSAKTATQ